MNKKRKLLSICVSLFVSCVTFNVGAEDLTGLWRGLVEVSKVSEVHNDVDDPTIPRVTTRGFSLPILLHSNGDEVHLLSEVTLMQTKPQEGRNIEKVLITDTSLISDYDGVVRRSQKLTGIRFTAPTFVLPTDADEKPLGKINFSQDSPLQLGETYSVSLVYSASHPVNPFRHQYHPDLSTGSEIIRDITLSFDSADDESPIDIGDTRLSGSYFEKVSGLHDLPIFSEGRFVLQKVSNIATLDGQ